MPRYRSRGRSGGYSRSSRMRSRSYGRKAAGRGYRRKSGGRRAGGSQRAVTLVIQQPAVPNFQPLTQGAKVVRAKKARF